MDTSQFWRLIEQSKSDSGDCDEQIDALTSTLLKLPADEIEEFDVIFYRFHAEAYRNDVWAAAYIMNGGCSDHCFLDFRSWLIGQGEAIYTAALRDPGSLVSVVESTQERTRAGVPFYGYECQHLAYAADVAYEQKTGHEMPARSYSMPELIGEDWEDDDLPMMYPRLCAVCEWA
ncbi:MAG TPA: DUF4240 domain-containing protein [Ktedonobacterales bacterium]|jgi:uncharacterized protein DUF4240|nr:DUF4240 domain-containing protein [Ktedonobacterales bacterium]